ncbi:hypothetical protein H696_06032 [Fonticula alba]|uniref:Uncharacterized protein n=1 Tax=Fonticula alba TaxID=691883 RepID=A0A058Z0T7_FONAL|nr:hypothetical protein H696_06032 [Fonticula alba]KCV67513.1 hypothetical protein H696_06032 [Fonticula alba]|eukprot:XP_009498074.1 hypothetical protein H696_06032 [Fonticula alba]
MDLLFPVVTMALLLKAGAQVIVHLDELHAFMNNPASLDKIRARSLAYQSIISTLLGHLGLDAAAVRFHHGQELLENPSYMMDFYRLTNMVTEREAMSMSLGFDPAAASVLSRDLSPLFRGLNGLFLGADVQVGGLEQISIFQFGRRHLSDYKVTQLSNLAGSSTGTLAIPSAHLTSRFVSDLSSGQLFGAAARTTPFLDGGRSATQKAVRAIFCEEGNTTRNVLLAFVQHVVAPVLAHFPEQTAALRASLEASAPGLFPLADVGVNFADKKIHPGDLKNFATDFMAGFLPAGLVDIIAPVWIPNEVAADAADLVAEVLARVRQLDRQLFPAVLAASPEATAPLEGGLLSHMEALDETLRQVNAGADAVRKARTSITSGTLNPSKNKLLSLLPEKPAGAEDGPDDLANLSPAAAGLFRWRQGALVESSPKDIAASEYSQMLSAFSSLVVSHREDPAAPSPIANVKHAEVDDLLTTMRRNKELYERFSTEADLLKDAGALLQAIRAFDRRATDKKVKVFTLDVDLVAGQIADVHKKIAALRQALQAAGF